MTASGHAIAIDDTSESELLVLLASLATSPIGAAESPATLATYSSA